MEKNPHTTDGYTFRFIDKGGHVMSEPLFFGMLEGEESELPAEAINESVSREIHECLCEFAKTAPNRARSAKKCLIERPSGHENICLIACTSDRGTIIGGWYNSDGDTDLSMQMLAYCMSSFCMLNNVDGIQDKALKRKAIDTIPDDTRFGKYPAKEAEKVFLRAMAERPKRMLERAKRDIAFPVS
ncbi:MAG: hypothetical protein K6F57_02310 [Candidatus Saccharibacteria bacterium]|nr:hypothetical protein [Candidatus Saccharibacteria bacterium]